MLETDVLILGGGAAGLACRARVGTLRQSLLLEAATELGGLLKVRNSGAFKFDTCVHVLFFRDRGLESWVLDLLSDGVHRIEKRNLIWQHQREIPYPYQYHGSSLPDAIRQECLEHYLARSAPAADAATENFEDWLLRQFGVGFYRHFFKPYNQKLYGLEPALLAAQPLTWMIPSDDERAVLRGMANDYAQQPASPSGRGFYPRGPRGVAAVIDALAAAPGGQIFTRERVRTIDPGARVLRCESGLECSYRTLVTSLPLPVLAEALDPLLRPLLRCDESATPWAALLPATELTMVEIGSRRSGPGLDAHWTYFPDADAPFYRLVRLEKISPDLAPPGGTSLLLECRDKQELRRDELVRLLVQLRVLADEDVDHFAMRHVPYAYVLFTPRSRELSRAIQARLSELEIYSIGRYGTWAYASIEDALRSGVDAGQRLRAQLNSHLNETDHEHERE